MGVIRAFHGAMGELLREYEATVGWFAGYGVMAWFNDPFACPDPAARAAAMAVDMRTAMMPLIDTWRRRGHELDLGVGIALGYATLGTIGFEGRYDYGAVGSVMNLASRLCDEAGPSQILISARALASAGEQIEAESVGELTLKGFDKPVPAFNVLSVTEPEAGPGGLSRSTVGWARFTGPWSRRSGNELGPGNAHRPGGGRGR
jgi:class 3 adenylate cyclase